MQQPQTTKAAHSDKLALDQEEPFSGISFLPRTKLEQLKKQREMSPRSIKRKVNTFIETQILSSNQATAVMFEELSSTTNKIHRQAMRQKLGSIEDGPEFRLRGQTAGAGIRLNAKLASYRRAGLSTQSTANRSYLSPRNGQAQADKETRHDSSEITTLMSKSLYPGTPFRVSQDSVLGQTLNKFELGEQNKTKLKHVSGIEYYKQHIHHSQARRLKKFMKDPAGHGPKSKHFIPLSDVEKPSMQGRVKMYMQRLNEEEQKEKSRLNRVTNNRRTQDKDNFNQLTQASCTSQGQIEPNSPNNQKQVNIMKKTQYKGHGTVGQSESKKFSEMKDPRKPSLDRGSSTTKNFLASSPTKNVRLPPDVNVTSFMSNELSIQRRDSKPAKSQVNPKTPVQARETDNISGLDDLGVVQHAADDYSNVISSSLQNMQNMQRKMSKPKTKTSFEESKILNHSKMITPSKFANKTKSQVGEKSDNKKNNGARIFTNGDLYTEIAQFKLFKPAESGQATFATLGRDLRMVVKKTYLRIYNAREKGEKQDLNEEMTDEEVDNIKLNNRKLIKKYLMTYLKRRYTGRLAQKMASIFNWQNGQLEYDVFYQAIQTILLDPKDAKEPFHKDAGQVQIDPAELMRTHIRNLKKFAFQMLDMNCDQKICETDLFTFLESHSENQFFRKALVYDIQDIVAAFKSINEHLSLNSKTMDYSDKNAPKIKDLPKYLESAKSRAGQRKEIYDLDLYKQSLLPSPLIIESGTTKAQPTIDSADFFSSFGPTYKKTFKKIIGATMEEKPVVKVAKKERDDSESNKKEKSSKYGMVETSLREMRAVGIQQFAADHKKKPLLSYLIHKTDQIYDSKSTKVFLSEDDFIDKVHFQFGIPLLVIDFIDYMTGSKLIDDIVQKEFINPKTHVERFDAQNNDFNELKSGVDEEFLPYIFLLFDALGAIELDKAVPQEEKESKQYCTLESIQRNLPKVFGIQNDFFAEMLFSFISKHGPMNNKLNFHQFFERLKVFWPKKKENRDFEDNATKEWRKRNAKNTKKEQMRKFVFDFIRLSGGKTISILDLIKLCCFFPENSCTFGDEVEVIMNKYKQFNIEPKYVHQRTEFGIQQYLKFVPFSVLISDFQWALVGQFKAKLKADECDSNYGRKQEEKSLFPLSDWKMASIFDEPKRNEKGRQTSEYKEYHAKLNRRKGLTGEEESRDLMRQNKKVEEMKMDRGFDIHRTWNIRNILDHAD